MWEFSVLMMYLITFMIVIVAGGVGYYAANRSYAVALVIQIIAFGIALILFPDLFGVIS